jgi:hypothetical protein
VTAAQAGLALYTALALVAGFLTRRVGLTLVVLAAGWVPRLLARDPATGRTLLIVAVWVALARWGWRHLTLWVFAGYAFATLTWQQIQTGHGPAAVLAAPKDALNRVVYAAALIALAWWAWQLVTRRVGYAANPAAWDRERRRLQTTQEHQRAMGYARRGLGRAGTAARRAVTAKPRRRRPTPDGTVTVPDTGDLGIPEPLFHPRRTRR